MKSVVNQDPLHQVKGEINKNRELLSRRDHLSRKMKNSTWGPSDGGTSSWLERGSGGVCLEEEGHERANRASVEEDVVVLPQSHGVFSVLLVVRGQDEDAQGSHGCPTESEDASAHVQEHLRSGFLLEDLVQLYDERTHAVVFLDFTEVGDDVGRPSQEADEELVGGLQHRREELRGPGASRRIVGGLLHDDADARWGWA